MPAWAPPMYAMPSRARSRVTTRFAAFVQGELADVVECDVHGDERLHPTPQCDGEAENEHDCAALQLRRVVGDLLTDERELGQR